jgi:hypothetical protein
MRVSSPPVGTLSSASDVTDGRNENSKPHCGTPRAGNAMSQRLLALTRAGCAARAGLTARLAVY